MIAMINSNQIFRITFLEFHGFPRNSVSRSQVLSWIDEGKLPEQNVESARAVRDSLAWHFLPEVLTDVESTAAVCLCKWMVAIFAYFDAVENWEP